jgi:hypothetical protein
VRKRDSPLKLYAMLPPGRNHESDFIVLQGCTSLSILVTLVQQKTTGHQ